MNEGSTVNFEKIIFTSGRMLTRKSNLWNKAWLKFINSQGTQIYFYLNYTSLVLWLSFTASSTCRGISQARRSPQLATHGTQHPHTMTAIRMLYKTSLIYTECSNSNLTDSPAAAQRSAARVEDPISLISRSPV